MKSIIVLGLQTASVLLLTGCLAKEGVSAPQPLVAVPLEGTKWRLKSMMIDGVNKPLAKTAEPITANFKKGSFTGFSGCNRYDAAFEAKKDVSFRVSELSGTKMACLDDGAMEMEKDFLGALGTVRQHEVNKYYLTLHDGAYRTRLVFVPFKAPKSLPLAGTHWTLVHIEEEDGETVSATPGVNQDYTKAIEWNVKAVEQGDAAAQYNLGMMYFEGKGATQDDKKASEWLLKAADQGHAIAQYNLGSMYATGRGVPQDDKKAIEWCIKAANQGFPQALTLLKSLNEEAKKAPQD